MTVSALLDSLTDPQREAVTHVDGPLLVLAGPGSGKTTVVTRRIAYLIGQGVPPWQVLALTFTNKAAGEMRERVEALLPEDLVGRRGLTIATFHSFCVRLLRRYAEPAGLAPRFTVYDAGDQRDAIKRAIALADLNTKNWQPATVAAAISDAKNRLLDADALAAEASDFFTRSVARVYRHYQTVLRDNAALDFDDLLMFTARTLQGVAPVRQELQNRYQYVLVDEYQDTNHAQFVIARALACEHANICVVGDPDQSIYGWRGADITNILEFERHFPQARVIPLGQNFRSTGHIVLAASGLIEHNRRRKHKELSTDLGDGEKITIVCCRDEHHEAELIVDEFRRRHDEGDVPWKEMAVLYRVNSLSRVLEEAFRDARVPYVIARGTAFYDRKEVKDALAYLRLVANDHDEISLRRIVNFPPRGLGATTLQRLESFALSEGIGLMDALRRAEAVPGLTARACAAADRLAATVDGWRRPAGEGLLGGPEESLSELVSRVVSESGLERHFKTARRAEDQERAGNLDELITAAAEFAADLAGETGDGVGGTGSAAAAVARPRLDEVAAFLESVALVSDADTIDPERGAVTLMTLHTAKGLEFTVVAVAGLESGLLPHSRAAESEAEMEEERRLCFVGITRARRHLLMTSAAVRTMRGVRERTIPSPFLNELPEAHLVVSDQAPDGWEVDPYLDVERTGSRRRRGARSSLGRFTVGCLVRHPVFGRGRIETLMPRPRGSAARVDFEHYGVKTLILEYANLEVL